LGCGQSKKLCEAQGQGRVYLDFLKQIHREVSPRQKHDVLGDIILKYPKLIPELTSFGTPPSGGSNCRTNSPLPPEGGVPSLVALSWGYEADHPFDREAALFAKAKIPSTSAPALQPGRR